MVSQQTLTLPIRGSNPCSPATFKPITLFKVNLAPLWPHLFECDTYPSHRKNRCLPICSMNFILGCLAHEGASMSVE